MNERELGRLPLILVVEDDEDLVLAIRAILEGAGFQVLVAHNGLEGLETLNLPPVPDLIITDMEMPVMSGEIFCATIASEERWRDIPVVVHSGVLAEPAMFPGVNIKGTLPKGCLKETLIDTIRDALS